MTSNNKRPASWPCPTWCAGDHVVPARPTDGLVHSSAAETLMVTGNSERPGSQPLAVLIETWAPARAARLPAGLVTWSLDGGWGPHLTPAETRRFIAILNRLARQARLADNSDAGFLEP
jgi:hypothetical protein